MVLNIFTVVNLQIIFLFRSLVAMPLFLGACCHKTLQRPTKQRTVRLGVGGGKITIIIIAVLTHTLTAYPEVWRVKRDLMFIWGGGRVLDKSNVLHFVDFCKGLLSPFTKQFWEHCIHTCSKFKMTLNPEDLLCLAACRSFTMILASLETIKCMNTRRVWYCVRQCFRGLLIKHCLCPSLFIYAV